MPTAGQKGLERAGSAATAAAKAAFLVALAEGGSIAGAARACDRATRTVYDWRSSDAEFAEQWDEALQRAVALLEKEAWRRAVQGVDEPVVSGGKILTTVKRYSDSLLKTLLAAHRPEKYAKPSTGIAVQMHSNGPAYFSFRFEGDSLGKVDRNGEQLFDKHGNIIEAEPEPNVFAAEPEPEGDGRGGVSGDARGVLGTYAPSPAFYRGGTQRRTISSHE